MKRKLNILFVVLLVTTMIVGNLPISAMATDTMTSVIEPIAEATAVPTAAPTLEPTTEPTEATTVAPIAEPMEAPVELLAAALAEEVAIEEKPSVISAEIKSYRETTKYYYESMSTYSYGFYPGNHRAAVTLTLYLNDGTQIDVKDNDDEWDKYEIEYAYYTSTDENVSFDENGKLPTGEYYIEFTVLGTKYNLKIPYSVKSVVEEASELCLDEQESCSVDGRCGEVWYKFVPEESGVYKIGLTTRSRLDVRIYNSSFEQISSAGLSGTTYESVMGVNLEAGETHYYCLYFPYDGYLTASFLLEKVPSIVSAEIKSYEGSTTQYYETSGMYFYGGNATITLYLDDGTELDVDGISYDWNVYQIKYELYTSKGEKASYDANWKYPVGEYYLEFTILGGLYDLNIPCFVKSVSNEDTVELLEGQQQFASVEEQYDVVWYKFTPAESARYTFSIKEYTYVYLDIYNSSFKQITCETLSGTGESSSMSVILEAGETYYYKLEFKYSDYLNAIVVVDELAGVVSAEVQSHEGPTQYCYEIMNDVWDVIYNIRYRTTLTLQLDDGTEIDIDASTGEWGSYQIDWGCYTSDGLRASSDANGKYPIGDYYGELTVLGEKHNLIIPYSVISYVDIPTEGICGENLNWTFDESGELKLSGTGAMSNYNNSESVPWNYHRENITSVVLPDELTSIGDYAFSDCTSLTSVEFSNSLTSIGESAFNNCTSLTSIELPDRLTSIGARAFSNCTSLSNIEVLDDETPVLYSSFASVPTTCIVLPGNLMSIGEYAFYNCTSLISIELPDGVDVLNKGVFKNCNNIQTIIFGEGLEEIYTNSGSDHALYGMINVTEVAFTGTIVPTMTNVGCSPFEYMTSLETVYVPADAYDDYMTAFASYSPSTATMVAVDLDDVTPVYGDANGDNEINTKDIILSRKYVASKDPTTGESTVEAASGADANGDGTINTKDIILMRKYVASKDPVTGESSVVLGPNQ